MKHIYTRLFLLVLLNLASVNSQAQVLTSVDPDTVMAGLDDGYIMFTGTGINAPSMHQNPIISLIGATDTINSFYYYSNNGGQFYTKFHFIDAVTGWHAVQYIDYSGVLLNIPNAVYISPNTITGTATLVFPVGGQLLNQCSNQLVWSNVIGTSEYYMEYDTTKDFSSRAYTEYPIYTQPNSGTISTFRGKNYWRVRAKRGHYFGTWSAIDSFTVSATPHLNSITPDSAYTGEILNPTISGTNTHFWMGSSTMSFTLSKGSYSIAPISRVDGYNDTIFNSSTFQIPALAPTGLYDVNYYNVYDDTLKLYNAFYINAGNTISGRVYLDENSNQIFDAGDFPYSQAHLTVPPIDVWSQSNGTYTGYLPNGTFNISLSNLPTYFTSTPSSHSINFPGYGGSQSGLDFALTPVPGVHDLQVWPSINRPSPRPGFSITVTLNYYNYGPVVESGQLKFIPPSNLSLMSVSNTNYTMSGDTMIWDFTSLAPFQTGSVVIEFSVPTNLAIGTLVHYEIGVEGTGTDITPNNNYMVFDQVVSNSYDPNSKSAVPEQLNIAHIPLGEYLNYTIHFQNTGNDTAYNVRILDTLSTNLDLSTIEVTGASHNYTTVMYPDRVVEFRFANINLPDSNVNEEMSNGYITYRIKANTNLTLADSIINIAYNYFDFNPPMATNPCITTIAVGVKVDELADASSGILISPNPFSEKTEINYTLSEEGDIYLTVLNDQGKLISPLCKGKQSIGKHTLEFDASELPAGVYFVALKAEGKFRMKKLVVIK